jgi:hypothetical protein
VTMTFREVPTGTRNNVYYPQVLATFVVLAVNPACSPNGTVRVAGQTAAWPGRPTPMDEEPTWEDAAWQ